MQSRRSISNASFQSDYNSRKNTPRSSKDPSKSILESTYSPISPITSDLKLKSQDENFAPNGDLCATSNLEVHIAPAEEYSLYKPANMEEAKAHGVMSKQLAQRVRKLDPGSVLDPQDAPKFSLNCKVNEIAQIGPYFSMYFYYIRYVALMLLIFFLCVGLPCLIGNISQDGYVDEKYDIARTSVVNYTEENNSLSDDIPLYQLVIHIVADVFLIGFYIFFIIKMTSKSLEIKLGTTEASDFTIWVSNLPKNYDVDDLKLYFENQGRFDGKYAEVVSVIPIYDVANLLKVHKKLNNLKCEEVEHTSKIYIVNPAGRSEYYGRKINKLEGERKKLEEIVVNKKTDKALITFRHRTDAMRILEDRYSNKFMHLLDRILCKNDKKSYSGNIIRVNSTPDPTDLRWENMNVSKCYLLTILAIKVILGGALIYLSLIVSIFSMQADFYFENEVSLVISLIIILINYILEVLMLKLAKYYLYRFERFKNWSDYNISVTLLLGISTALNTCLVPTSAFSRHVSYLYAIHARTIFNVLISNAIITPILYIVSPGYQLKRYKRWKLLREYDESLESVICQVRANPMFVGPKIDLADRNVHLIQTYVITMFYAPLLPIGILIGAITLIIDYWTTKIMLLRFHSRPKKYAVGVYDYMLPWIPWGIYLHAVRYKQSGVVTFFNFDSIYYIICILLFLIIPIRRIVKRIYKKSTADILDKILDGDSKENDYYKQLPYFHTVRYM